MPSDVRIWDGAAWVSLRGPAGPSAVSTNAGQLAKLGTDNLILVSSTDLDARYVNVAGDTMTGVLNVKPVAGPTLPDGSVLVIGDNTNANLAAVRNAETGAGGVLGLSRSRGTNAAPTATQVGDQLGTISWRGHANAAYSVAGYIRNTMIAAYQAGDTALRGLIEIGAATGTANATAVFITGGNVGIQWSTPTYRLEVNGNTMLRGTLDVTGNITSTGTAHSFAAKSIPASAIDGVPAIKADDLTDVAVTTPAAGQVLRWNGTSFVNSALGYTDLTGTPAATSPSTTAGLASTAAGTVGTSALYARADHTHPIQALKADDLTDVTVATPATGQVLRWNGTAFVNAALNFSDLSGTIANPTINAPSIYSAFALPQVQSEQNKFCVVLSAAPVASTTITGVQGYSYTNQGYVFSPEALILGKVNTVTGVFTGGIATYSGWVSMVLGPDERHACVYPSGGGSNAGGYTFLIRFYTATENSNWSSGVAGMWEFTGQTNTITGRFRRITASYTLFADDADDTIANVSTGATPVVITIPANSTAKLPVGTALDILDLSPTANTTLTAAAGVTLNWNSSLVGGSATVAGGVAASLTLLAPISKVTLYKTDTDSWAVFA